MKIILRQTDTEPGTRPPLMMFNYHGHVRTVRPLALGVSKAGEMFLRAVQISKDSEVGPPETIRVFVLSDIDAVTVLPDHCPACNQALP